MSKKDSSRSGKQRNKTTDKPEKAVDTRLLDERVRLARKRGFFVTASTNLTLYHRFPTVLDPAHLIFTSLDGDRATHERQRGERGQDLEQTLDATSGSHDSPSLPVRDCARLDDPVAGASPATNLRTSVSIRS